MVSFREARGNAQIITAFALAGSSVVAGKFLVASLHPFSSSFLSLACAFAFLLPVLARNRRKIAAARRLSLLSIAIQALLGMALFRIFMLQGLSRTSAVHAGIISSLGPLVMAAAAFVFLGEKPGPRLAAGVLLGTAGIALMRLSGPGGAAAQAGLWGDLLVFAAVCCEAGMAVVRKRSGVPFDPLTTAALIVAASVLYTLPLAAIECARFGLPRIGPLEFLAVMYYGAVATALAYFFWAAGSAAVSGSTIAVAMVAAPLSTVLLSIPVLGERPEALSLAGLALGMGGMVLGQAPPKAGRPTPLQ
jgi:drug/metabolite transporter (DMT)-like permease